MQYFIYIHILIPLVIFFFLFSGTSTISYKSMIIGRPKQDIVFKRVRETECSIFTSIIIFYKASPLSSTDHHIFHRQKVIKLSCVELGNRCLILYLPSLHLSLCSSSSGHMIGNKCF